MAYFIEALDFSRNPIPIFEVKVFDTPLLELIKKRGDVLCFCMFSGTSDKTIPFKKTPVVFLEGEHYNKTFPVIYMNDEKYQAVLKEVTGSELTDIIVVRGEYIPVKPTTVIYGVDNIDFLNKTLSPKQPDSIQTDDSDDEPDEDEEKNKYKRKKEKRRNV